MPFSGNENHDIDLNEAITLTKAYRDFTTADAIRAVYFSKSGIEKLLNQSGCVGIRVYNALKDGKHTFVITGVTEDENDIVDGNICEDGLPCPPFCSSIGKL